MGTPGRVVESKGLKENALGFVSSVVIGVASTAHKLVHVSERPVLVARAR
jgi:hypothetical protein